MARRDWCYSIWCMLCAEKILFGHWCVAVNLRTHLLCVPIKFSHEIAVYVLYIPYHPYNQQLIACETPAFNLHLVLMHFHSNSIGKRRILQWNQTLQVQNFQVRWFVEYYEIMCGMEAITHSSLCFQSGCSRFCHFLHHVQMSSIFHSLEKVSLGNTTTHTAILVVNHIQLVTVKYWVRDFIAQGIKSALF